MLITDVLNRTDPKVETQVKRAAKQHRRALQESLRRECGLALQGDGDPVQVRVTIEPGWPMALGQVELPDNYEQLIELARYRRELKVLAVSGETLANLSPATLATVETASRRDPRPSLRELVEWAQQALMLLDLQDPVRPILAINEDVLGVYRYWPSARADDDRAPNRASIELYWMVIGLVSDLLGCSVEDLTAVVLTHELAHAFTQLGADTDGRRWPAADFRQAETGLKEGLAQYYTHRVLEHRRSESPGPWVAYRVLLDGQPPAYHTHAVWIDEFSPEAVRRALVETRHWGERKVEDFHRRLEEAQEGLPYGEFHDGRDRWGYE